MKLVYGAILWSLGIFLAPSFPTLTALGWGALALFALGVWIILPQRLTRWVALGILILALGGARYALLPPPPSLPLFNGQTVSIEGIVIAQPDVRDTITQLRIQAHTLFNGSATYVVEGVLLANVSPEISVQYGDRIQVGGDLLTPAEGDTFSYADYLARQGVFSWMPVATLNVLGASPLSGVDTFLQTLISARLTAQQTLSNLLPQPHSGLLTGILLGNDRALAPELGEAFSRVGASHVIAISGYNMAVISGVLLAILTRGSGETTLKSVLLAIGVLAIYTLFVGANSAVVRATLMSSLLIVAPLLRRKTYLPASLAFVVVVMSVYHPAVLWDVSFQLSFCAILGMMLFVEPLNTQFQRVFGGAGTWWREAFTVTLSAQIATTPLMVLYFQQFSWVALLVNMLIIPVQAPLLLIGGVALLISPILPVLSQGLFWLDMVFLGWTISMVRAFSEWAGAGSAVYVDSRLVGAFYVMLIGGTMTYSTRSAWVVQIASVLRKRSVLSAVVGSGVLIGLLLVGMWRSVPDGKLHVWWLDMGHSNSVLLQTPQGAHILVDGGRTPTRLLTALGDRLPFYDNTLEMLILTHPDDVDHSALLRVLERYHVGVVLTNGQAQVGVIQTQLDDLLHDVPQVNAVRGYRAQTSDGVLLEVLHPASSPDLGDSLGDGVLVLRVTYGERSFLLTSDLSREAQARMLEEGVFAQSDVMQVPQHATARALSASFLAHIQPSLAVVQIDPANRIGDPNTDTLALFGEAIPVWRTDLRGTIHLISDGETVWGVGEP